jgi:hypothetical protein
MVFTLTNGKVVRFQEFTDSAAIDRAYLLNCRAVALSGDLSGASERTAEATEHVAER